MVPLLLIKPKKKQKSFPSKPVSNVKEYPNVPWQTENRASYSSMKASPHDLSLPFSFLSDLLTCVFSTVLPTNNPLFSQTLSPHPSSIVLPPPGKLSFPTSTISQLTKFRILGSPNVLYFTHVPLAPGHMHSLPPWSPQDYAASLFSALFTHFLKIPPPLACGLFPGDLYNSLHGR